MNQGVWIAMFSMSSTYVKPIYEWKQNLHSHRLPLFKVLFNIQVFRVPRAAMNERNLAELLLLVFSIFGGPVCPVWMHCIARRKLGWLIIVIVYSCKKTNLAIFRHKYIIVVINFQNFQQSLRARTAAFVCVYSSACLINLGPAF